jgi:DNA-binding CsgD family transcriptional regulator
MSDKVVSCMEMNDFLAINNIIYRIYTNPDLDAMRYRFFEQMKMLLDFDSADFFLANLPESTPPLCRPIYYHCENTGADLYDALDYSRGILYSGKSMVYRESDILSEEARLASDYYKKVYLPNHWHYALQMILGRNKRLLGVATFYRQIGKQDFGHNDVFLVDMLKDHMSWRLLQELNRQKNEKLTVAQAAEKFRLTPQEKNILALLLSEKPQKEIAVQLVISLSTLKKHITSILDKVGANSRIQLFKMISENDDST